MKKYSFTLVLGLSLLLLGCSSNLSAQREEEQSTNSVSSDEEVTLVIASDLHYLSPELTDYGNFFMNLIQNSDGKLTHYTPDITQAFVEDVLSISPTAVVLSGDLTLNGDKQSHEGLIAVLNPLVEADIPVYVVPGNHDVDGYAYRFDEEGTHRFNGSSSKEFVKLYSELGYDNALSKDRASLSYTAKVSDDVWLLMLDVNGNGLSGNIHNRTLRWIEQQLERAQEEGATVIGVSHQNLTIHNDLFQYGYQMGRAEELMDLYKEYDVQVHLSGHLHLQNIIEQAGITEIATSSMAITPNQFAVLQIDRNKAMSYETMPVNVSKWAEEQSLTDQNLLDFSIYTEQFFNKTTELKLIEALDSLNINEDERKQMIEFGTNLNRHYFTGTLTEEHYDEEILALWEANAPSEFFTRYFNSLKEEDFRDKNSWELPAD